jgi:hypothetical protein
MIDYTEVDRQLIYKDRSGLADFKVDDLSETIEHQFYRRLSNERFMLLSVDAAKYALDIFNDAYYICTLFYMVEHPKLYHAWFREKIAARHKKKFLTTATMTLVYLLLGEERQQPYTEEREFVKLVSHFILEDGENVDVFTRLTNGVLTGGTISYFMNPYTAIRFKRRDIFEILHADGFETLCAKNIDYVIEEVMRRKPAEEAVSELLALRKKLEAYFKKYDILEYSDEDFNAWMIARDKIDSVIGYAEDDKDKEVLAKVGHDTTHCKVLTWDEKKQCFKNAVLNVMNRKKHNGDSLFEKNTQWKAVYRYCVDIGFMYNVDDPNTPQEPQDKSKSPYADFEKFAKELQLDTNPPTRLPFTKSAINDITKPNYDRYNAPYPWSQVGITSDHRSILLYTELEEVYLALQEEYENLVWKAERSL